MQLYPGGKPHLETFVQSQETNLVTFRAADQVSSGDKLNFQVLHNEIIVSCLLSAERQGPSS